MGDDAALRAAIVSARQRATHVGPMHALWDVIFDAEAFLAGNRTLADWGPPALAIERLTAKLL